MQYRDLEQLILGQAEIATEAARERFARDSVALLRTAVGSVVSEELTEFEQQLLTDLFDGLDSRPPADSKKILETLDQSMSKDEIRATEFDHRLTHLLVSVDYYLQHQLTGDSELIGQICVTMIESVDFEITMLGEGAPRGYGTENMLGDPRMVAEVERQKRLLAGGPSRIGS